MQLERTYDAHQACYRSSYIRRKLLGEQSPELAEVLNQHAEVKAAQDRSKDAIALSDQALVIMTAQKDSTPLKIAEFKFTAAQLRCTPYTLQEAAELCQEILELMESTDNYEHFLAIQTLGLLGDIYYEMGQRSWEKALKCFQNAYEIAENQLGPVDSLTLNYLQAQITLCEKAGLEDMTQQLTEQLNGVIQLDNCTETLETANALNRLGSAKLNKGEYGKAEAPFKQVLQIRKILLGNEHPDMARCLNNLAVLYDKQGRYSEAEPLYQQALAMQKRLLGNEHPDVATSLHSLAMLYDKQVRYSEADPLYQQTLVLFEQILGPDHPSTNVVRGNLQGLQDRQNQ